MKIAFYKAFQPRATKLDKLIAICTFGRYSHVELVFSDGVCFGTSPRDNGARFKKIEMKPEQWLTYDIPCTKEQEQNMRNHCLTLVGMGYDTVGAIFSAIPHIIIQDSNKIFCSEITINLCNLFLGWQYGDGAKYSPNKFEKKMRISK